MLINTFTEVMINMINSFKSTIMVQKKLVRTHIKVK